VKDKTKGLYTKYIIKRVDGKSFTGAIVLEWDDPDARVGIAAYARQLKEKGYVGFASDLERMLSSYKDQIHFVEEVKGPKIYGGVRSNTAGNLVEGD